MIVAARLQVHANSASPLLREVLLTGVREIERLEQEVAQAQTELAWHDDECRIALARAAQAEAALAEGQAHAQKWALNCEDALRERDATRAALAEAQAKLTRHEHCIVNLEAENAGLRDVLKMLEVDYWSEDLNDGLCPLCDQVKQDGHAPDCPLGAALAGGPR